MTIDPAYRWCCIARVDASDRVIVSKVSGYAQHDLAAFQVVDDQALDLTESPGWMEYLERSENRMNDAGGAGAYDAIRCDLFNEGAPDRWHIWGQDFHLKRLENSYKLTQASEMDQDSKENSFEQSIQQSRSIISGLLAEAARADVLRKYQVETIQSSGLGVEIRLVRVTLLWSVNSGRVLVRGHACSTAQPMLMRLSIVEPIVVTLAAHRTYKTGEFALISSLPSRVHNSQCKVASWTRLRKQMELPKAYKPPGVSEVLMVRHAADGHADLELLEGVSSNVFVIYKNGVLRTAPDKVLFGYVRELVLDAAASCGLTLDQAPIFLGEMEQWKEVFITSSSRLIQPVSRILVQSATGPDDFEEIWSDPTMNNYSDGKAAWSMLLDEILRRNEYPESTAPSMSCDSVNKCEL